MRCMRATRGATIVDDALIAQSRPDQSAPLVTRDEDVRHFARAAGLSLF